MIFPRKENFSDSKMAADENVFRRSILDVVEKYWEIYKLLWLKELCFALTGYSMLWTDTQIRWGLKVLTGLHDSCSSHIDWS